MIGLDSNLNIIVQVNGVTYITGYVLVQQYAGHHPAGWAIAKGKAYKVDGQRTTVLTGPTYQVDPLWRGMSIADFMALTGWAIPAPFL